MVPLGDGWAPEPEGGTEFVARPPVAVRAPATPAPVRPAPPAAGPERAAPRPVDLVIRGPVAAEPPVEQAPPSSPDRPVRRTSSTRMYAGLLGLVALVGAAVSVTVVLVVGRVQEAAPPELEPVVTPAPVFDTGRRPPPPPPPPRRVAPPPTHAPVTVRLATDGPRFTGVEITCDKSGFRKRVPFDGGQATVPAVPQGRCTAFFKGGAPASVAVEAGQTLQCKGSGDGVVCQ